MIKVKEKELKSVINKFSNYPIKIVFDGVLTGKIELNNCICKHESRSGNIEIKDIDMKNILNIETSLVYKILRDTEFKVLELFIDCDLIIKIERI